MVTTTPWASTALPTTWQRSYWQKSVGDDPLLHHGKDEILPKTASIVVIGSGLSGATIAYNLLQSDPELNIVCLEARELCSGASGRNAGHCRPDAFRGFADYAKLHGNEEARKIIASERITLNNVAKFVEKHKVDCELVLRPTCDLILSEEFERYVDGSFKAAKDAGVDVSSVKRLAKEEAQEYSGSPIALGAYTWPAASVHPLKLCMGVHRQSMLHPSYSLFTHCPVVQVAALEDGRWAVQTVRGLIATDKVVFATNAYTELLLPEVKHLIDPCGILATKVAKAPSNDAKIEPTMSLRFNLNRFYSFASQPDDSAVIGIGPQSVIHGSMDDSAPDIENEKALFDSVLEAFPGHGYKAGEDGLPVPGQGGYDYSWRGIVAFTADKVPLVGPLPGKKGLFIIAGMGGHGMARIFHCAPTLAKVMLGGEWDPELPAVFQVSEKRLQIV